MNGQKQKNKDYVKNIVRNIRENLKDFLGEGNIIKNIPLAEDIKEKIYGEIFDNEDTFQGNVKYEYAIVDFDTFDFSIEEDISINREEIDKKIKEKGIEALAFYAPFHLYNEYYWGIYYIIDHIIYFTEQLFQKPADKNLISQSIRLIREHELFHFQTEMAFTIQELLFETDMIFKIFDFFCQLQKNYYYKFQQDKINYLKKTNLDLEEALATAIQYNKCPNYLKNRLKIILKDLPKGYCDFDNYISETDFCDGLVKFVTNNQFCNKNIYPFNNYYMKHYRCYPLIPLIFPENYFYLSKDMVPEYIVINLRNCKVGIPFPKYNGVKITVYSNDHEPPHFHLFIPPDKEIGRFLYPEVKSYDGKKLSNDDIKKLNEYFKKYGKEIKNKLIGVYGNREEFNKDPIFL